MKNMQANSSIDKAELAHQVLATINIKRREDEDRRMGIAPPPRPQRNSERRNSKHGHKRDTRNGHNRAGIGQRTKQFDLGLNRFRFILSPSSCFSDVPLGDILAMQTADLWPHTVAVVACDTNPWCSICLDGINAGRALACGHVFCAVCIQRCLDAAEMDPMLQKCPVCSEGILSRSQLRRCEILTTDSSSCTYSLVRAMSPNSVPPLMVADRLQACRIIVATGEGMLRLLDKERSEVALSKVDMARFRDAHGLRLIQDIESELDKAQVEWKRHVGRAKRRSGYGDEFISGEAMQWSYQRSDGSHDYLHPVNLRCLAHHAQEDVNLLPETITVSKILEIEEWSDRKFSTMVKLGGVHLPDFPKSISIVEVELVGMTAEAIKSVEKETKDRARRREERDSRKLKQQLKAMEAEATVEENNRHARESEEALIRAFFGFEERRAEEELKQARERPVPAVNSFSSVVSSMGHFPLLGKSSPVLEPSKAPEKLSPQLEPLKSAWGVLSPAASSLGSTSSEASFANAASGGGSAKKVLWQNNPSRRAW